MLTYDIQININITAESEEQAEEKIKELMQHEMTRAALERQINSWDFVEYIEAEEEDPIDTATIGV